MSRLSAYAASSLFWCARTDFLTTSRPMFVKIDDKELSLSSINVAWDSSEVQASIGTCGDPPWECGWTVGWDACWDNIPVLSKSHSRSSSGDSMLYSGTFKLKWSRPVPQRCLTCLKSLLWFSFITGIEIVFLSLLRKSKFVTRGSFILERNQCCANIVLRRLSW